MRPDWWRVPRRFEGETVTLLAGGPSLTRADCDAAAAAGWRAIAINNSWELAPWADYLWFCDRKWWDGGGNKDWRGGHGARVLAEFVGEIVTLDNTGWLSHRRVHQVRNMEQSRGLAGPLWLDPPDGVMCGANSGYMAINLAVLLGAARLVLLGYDMQAAPDGRSHWHGGHPTPNSLDYWRRRCLPYFDQLAPALDALGVEVINATRATALEAFRRQDLESLLPDPRPAALSA